MGQRYAGNTNYAGGVGVRRGDVQTHMGSLGPTAALWYAGPLR